MYYEFTKMHGLGNDFVVFDAIGQRVSLSRAQIRSIADRHFGIGCDQVLLVEASFTPGIDFRYRIFNADGGEVEQCGNGARCFARFVRDKGLSDRSRLAVQTAAGVIHLVLEEDGQVTVDMGIPQFTPAKIPFKADAPALRYPLEIDGRDIEISVVSMGNPHAVLIVEDVGSAPVAELGAKIDRHERFPERANVGFMQVVDSGNIRLRVFERGVGETLACGTGACAAVVAGRRLAVLAETVRVALPGGYLVISWAGSDSPVIMTGPATRVYEGRIEL
jgi:diaminopimelate epimerase